MIAKNIKPESLIFHLWACMLLVSVKEMWHYDQRNSYLLALLFMTILDQLCSVVENLQLARTIKSAICSILWPPHIKKLEDDLALLIANYRAFALVLNLILANVNFRQHLHYSQPVLNFSIASVTINIISIHLRYSQWHIRYNQCYFCYSRC